ncbi:cytochrome-c peroxidase [Pseudoalteromonas sp. T1lg76]|uniref:cytochrome-c peroxidase n=1 Tax=Pseudoalteromonas sp. T1lg76 TaxID=2077103 RepID=UPI000CF6C7C2|nr:cytochrome c peroxidase [Pseudoalteromonas sp. T1lg76]
MTTKIALPLAVCFMLSACDSSDTQTQEPPSVEASAVEVELQSLIATDKIAPLAPPQEAVAIGSPLAQLGKQLFFTKALSGNLDTACASCHHPNLGGGDALSLPVGVEALEPDLLGPGRLHDASGYHHDGGPTVPRNSPSTFNLAFYQRTLFHDGRIEVLDEQGEMRTPDSAFGERDDKAGVSLAQAQARFPVTSKEEMRGFDFVIDGNNDDLRAALQARFQGNTDELAINNWLDAFRQGLEQPEGSAASLLTFDNITLAIAAYENSQVLIDNPWAAYLNGEQNAISEQAKRGALLFYKASERGGFACASCHQGGFFTDESFHVLAVPQIGRGKGDGEWGDDDFGRYRETKAADDKYAFRTPTLLNVTQTGPWGHSGAFTELSDMLVHHLQPHQSINDYVPDDTQPGIQIAHWRDNTELALAQLDRLQSEGKSQLQPQSYEPQQIEDLLAFLATLTDPCTQTPSCMNKWVPGENEQDADGLRLKAYADDGNLL